MPPLKSVLMRRQRVAKSASPSSNRHIQCICSGSTTHAMTEKGRRVRSSATQSRKRSIFAVNKSLRRHSSRFTVKNHVPPDVHSRRIIRHAQQHARVTTSATSENTPSARQKIPKDQHLGVGRNRRRRFRHHDTSVEWISGSIVFIRRWWNPLRGLHPTSYALRPCRQSSILAKT